MCLWGAHTAHPTQIGDRIPTSLIWVLLCQKLLPLTVSIEGNPKMLSFHWVPTDLSKLVMVLGLAERNLAFSCGTF